MRPDAPAGIKRTCEFGENCKNRVVGAIPGATEIFQGLFRVIFVFRTRNVGVGGEMERIPNRNRIIEKPCFGVGESLSKGDLD